MPELPEVETMIRDLGPRVIGRVIVGSDAAWPGEVVWPDFSELQCRIHGQRITGIWRRGKYAVLDLASGDNLIVHRGMSGSLLHRPGSAPMERFVRILFRLDDGSELRLDDPRKFGKVFLLRASGDDRPAPWARMGPEPLESEFTPQVLAARLEGRRGLLKPLLLNQSFVAGLGNIYVDEALFLAQLHPERRAGTLSPAEIRRLHGAIVDVLGAAIEGRGTTFSTYSDIEGRAGQYQDQLRVFRRAGARCPRCDSLIVRLVVGGRGTHICPHCQKR